MAIPASKDTRMFSILRYTKNKQGKRVSWYVQGRNGKTTFGRKERDRLAAHFKKNGLEYKSIVLSKMYPNKTHFSAHFTRAEFASKDRGGHKPVPANLEANAVRLANALEKVRAIMGEPISLLSVYRTPAHNKFVGGASQSKHMQAIAADIVIRNAAHRARLIAAAKRVPEIKGVGIYPNGGLHLDVRRSALLVTWSSW